MFETLAILTLVAVILGTAILVWLVLRRGANEATLPPRLDALEKAGERTERALRDDLARAREETQGAIRQAREDQAGSIQRFESALLERVTQIATLQQGQLEAFAAGLSKLTQSNEQRLDALRVAVEGKLQALQLDNAEKLEQMRATVNEKLHATLERRLGESFKLVSERLEVVHKGLGEMQTLAASVGDLKRVFSGVKDRGGWGEVQLGALLEQMLTPDQYATNVAVDPQSAARVEFAIRLPGRDGGERPVWLPIDSKFPLEDYQRLLDAHERADAAGIAECGAALERVVRRQAADIAEKYIRPPFSADFALLFVPSEGLFAEILRRPGLVDALTRQHRVALAGPTTLAVLLSALQMGFRTLAIEKRSSEVWKVLGAVKAEFAKFGDALDKVHKKLHEASNSIEDASKRSRAVERKLRDVEELPSEARPALLIEPEGRAAERSALD